MVLSQGSAKHPESRFTKLLVVIASYGIASDRYLHRLIDEYKSMPYVVDIVVCSNIKKPVPDSVELVVGMPSKDPWSLPFAHKRILVERANQYDLFIYSEDDTLATQESIEAFLRVSKMLHPDEIAGFLRYEQCLDGTKRYCDVHGHFHWDPTSVVRRSDHLFAFFTNEHSAFYILTREQLQRAIESGGYLVGPHRGKYDLACTAATDPYTQCGFRKLVCISHLHEFLLHHLPDKYVDTRFGIPEHMFEIQIHAMLNLSPNDAMQQPLIPVETRLRDAWYSKDHYEPAQIAVVDKIPKATKSVLSVGCGSGETERFLAGRGSQVTALCLDPIIASCAQSSGVKTLWGEPERLFRQLSNCSFECVLFSNVLHLARDPMRMLSEFCAMLVPGGTCVIVSPNLHKLRSIIGRLRGGEEFVSIGEYEQSGTNDIRVDKFRQLLSYVGIDEIRIAPVVPERKQKASRWTLGLFDSILGDEFVVVGRKALSPVMRHDEEAFRASTVVL